jgi:hypothetical protein
MEADPGSPLRASKSARSRTNHALRVRRAVNRTQAIIGNPATRGLPHGITVKGAKAISSENVRLIEKRPGIPGAIELRVLTAELDRRIREAAAPPIVERKRTPQASPRTKHSGALARTSISNPEIDDAERLLLDLEESYGALKKALSKPNREPAEGERLITRLKHRIGSYRTQYWVGLDAARRTRVERLEMRLSHVNPLSQPRLPNVRLFQGGSPGLGKRR